MVFSSGGRTVSRNRSGNVVHRGFASLLPSGSYLQSNKKNTVTILDCIWISRIGTYYVMDCILWSDQTIGSSEAAFRMWFIRSKLAECGRIDEISKENKFRFVAMETMEVNTENLQFLYRGGNLLNPPNYEMEQNAKGQNGKEQNQNISMEMEEDANGQSSDHQLVQSSNPNQKQIAKRKWRRIQPDGLIFYHKHCCYVQRLSCPLVLVWKDRTLSRWFIDSSNRQHQNKALQFVTLQLRHNGTVTTHEEEVVLGALSKEEIERRQFVPNQLLRFSITKAMAMEWKVENLEYVKRSGNSKMQADTWSKILFQHHAKNGGGVTFDDLVMAVMAGIITDEGDETEDELRTATLGMAALNVD